MSQRFVKYYVNQAGGGPLQGFSGVPVMYGRGLGAMLSRGLRFIFPFIKRGFEIAKPHLKRAATGLASGLASDVVGRVTSKLARKEDQEGSGLGIISRKKKRKNALSRVICRNTGNNSRKKALKKPRKRSTSKREDIF